MCNLPNFAASNLTEIVHEEKKLKRQLRTQNLKITVANHPLLKV